MADRPIDVALRWMRERGWKQADLARQLGVTSQDVTNWKARGLPAAWHSPIAELFGRSVEELTGKRQIPTRLHVIPNVEEAPPGTRVPLISWVQAGGMNGVEDQYHPGDADEWVEARESRPGPRTFALRVVGESMTNPYGFPSFPPGAVIIVDPDRAPEPGKFVVAKDVQTQQATFKKLVFDGGRWYLKPLNPSFPSIEIDDPGLRVIGVAIEMTFSTRL